MRSRSDGGLTVGHVIVRQLEAFGVERTYIVPGESYLEVLDGLYDSEIQTVVARHEGSAGFMALAESRLTGKAGIVMVTRGPGAANAMIAVHSAWKESTPLVLFVGLVPINDRGLEPFQEFDLSAWFGSVSKKVYHIDHPDSAAEVVAAALDLSVRGRQGPVVVGLPEEVLRLSCRADARPPRSRPRRSTIDPTAIGADLERAQRPLIVVGSDRWTDLASQGLQEFAERWSIPVTSDYRNYDAFDNASPAWIGSLGIGRGEAAARAYDEADVVIMIGIGHSDVLSDGFAIGGKNRVVHVASTDPDVREHVGSWNHQYVTAPDDFVSAVNALSAPETAPWAQSLREARAAYLGWSTPRVDDLVVEEDRIQPEFLFGELAKRLDETVVTFGSGNYTKLAQRYLRRNRPRTLVAPRNGAMGVGLPAGIAAGLARPELRPLVLAGDGCFGMNGMEFITAVRYGVRVVVVIVDNEGYGTIADFQEHRYPGRAWGTDLINPDFAEFARSCGGAGELVSDPAALVPALDRAFDSPLASLVHVRVPSVNARASTPTRKMRSG